MTEADTGVEIEIPTKWIVLSTLAVGLCFMLWGIRQSGVAQKKSEELQQAKAHIGQLEKKVTALESESKSLKEDNSALREYAASVLSFHEGALEKKYPHLRRVKEGLNHVNEKYVVSYEYSQHGVSRRLKVVLENNTDRDINPNVRFHFLTKEGFLTARKQIGTWMFDSIKPGEKRVEESFVKPSHGEAMYLDLTVK